MGKEYPSFVKNSSLRPIVIRVAGYVGAAATTALTVRQYTENYDGALMLIYSALAFAICVFEFIAVHDAKKYYNDKKYLYAALYLIAGIGAFIFDISGTIGYMSSAVTKSLQEESLKKEMLDSERSLSGLRQKQINGIQNDNKNIQLINNEFISRGRISKAKESIHSMRSNENLIASIVKQEEAANLKRADGLWSIKADPLLSFYKSVSNLFDFEVSDVKKWFEVLIAATASLVSILMSGYKSDEEIIEEAQLSEIRKKEKELKNKIRMADINSRIAEIDNDFLPPDGSGPKGKRPSLDKKDPVHEQAPQPLSSPSMATVSAIHAEQPLGVLADVPGTDTPDVPIKVRYIRLHPSRAGKGAEGSFKNEKYSKKIGRSNQKKRAKGNADTDTVRGKNFRYRMIVSKVKKRQVAPSVRAIKKSANCSQVVAVAYLEAMREKGILRKLDNGKYELIQKVELKIVKAGGMK